MGTIMSWVRQSIADFGKTIGMHELHMGPENKVQLKFGEHSIISFSYIEHLPIKDIVISKTTENSYISFDTLKKLLESSHFELNPHFVLQNAVIEHKLVSSIRVLERNFNVSTIEQSLNFLENS
jgi:hypothetical protein